MKKKIFNALLFIVLILCIFVLTFFRSSGSSGLWKTHVVLITPVSVSGELVLKSLSAVNITGVVSYSSAFLDLYPSFFPITSYFSKEDSSLFFTDKSKNYSLYYIPREFESAIQTAKRNSQFSFDFFLDTEQSIPPVSLLSSLVIGIFLLIISKNRTIFLSLAFPAVIFSACFPELSLIPPIICLLYIAYYIQQKYGRHDILISFRSHTFVLLLSLLTIISLVFTPLHILIFVLVLLFTSFSCFLLVHNFTVVINSKKRFVPLLIFSSLYKKKEGKLSPLIFVPASVSLVLCIVFMLFYSNFSEGKGSAVLPSPAKASKDRLFSYQSYENCLEKSQDIPSLSHFVSDCWNSSVFPYKRVTDDLFELPIPLQSTAGITRYVKDGTSIKSYYETLFTFDNTFIDSILMGIDYSNSDTIQQVLLGQNTFSPIEYKPVASGTGSKKRLILLSISCIFFFMLMFISYRRTYSIKDHA